MPVCLDTYRLLQEREGGGKKGKYKCWKLRLSALSTSAEALRLDAIACRCVSTEKKYQIDILCWPFHAPKLRASAFYCSSTKILWGIRDIVSRSCFF